MAASSYLHRSTKRRNESFRRTCNSFARLTQSPELILERSLPWNRASRYRPHICRWTQWPKRRSMNRISWPNHPYGFHSDKSFHFWLLFLRLFVERNYSFNYYCVNFGRHFFFIFLRAPSLALPLFTPLCEEGKDEGVGRSLPICCDRLKRGDISSIKLFFLYLLHGMAFGNWLVFGWFVSAIRRGLKDLFKMFFSGSESKHH